jgi:TonB-linked SusC/RagA family outer membrane protein
MTKKLLKNPFWSVFILAIMCSFRLLAQNNLVTGIVTDETGSAIPGASVSLKGTTQGTTTDSQGMYSIAATSGNVLVFSFIGFKKVEINVANARKIDVKLESEASVLNEVVVTALGQTQEKRALGYSVQSVKADEIKNSGDPNVIGALQGKIAGAIITGSGGAPGAGVNIILRGITSLSGGADNQPLFVIDGIIISNTTSAGNPLPSAGSNSPGASEQFANTNRAADINPDDIENISVLKGPAATALYGLRASNGAIIITTKRGKSGKLSISVSSSVGVDVLGKSPSIQTTFLQGRLGEFIPLGPGRTPYQSFGPVIDPQNTTDKIYDNFRGFYKTGIRNNNNITLTKGNDKGNIYLSLGRNSQSGIIPNTNFQRTSAKIAGAYNITQALSVSGSFNYINSGGKRPPAGDKSVFSALSYWPNTYDVNDYLNADGTQKNILPGFTDNPRYLVEKSPRIDKVNRYISDITLNYKIASWLSAKYQLTYDTFHETRSRQVDSTFDVGIQVKGFMVNETLNFRELNSNLYVTAQKDFNKDWGGSILVGNSVVDSKRPNSYYIRGEGFTAPYSSDISSYRNQQKRFYSPGQFRIVSFFADAKLNFREILYLNATVRNDIVSTLPKANNSFVYPSFNLGYVFTEHLPKNNFFTYGKLRASWAQVGKGTDPYVTGSYFDITDNFPYNNNTPGYFRRLTTADPNLKPERTTSIEFGTELRFLKNRLMIDATYFTMDSKDQIVRAPVSNVSGYLYYYTNIGLIRNKGVELLVNLKPVQTKDFIWDVAVNWAKMSGRVIEMPAELQEISYYDNTVGSLKVRQGSKVGDLWGYDYLRAPDGQMLINASTGFPQTSTVLTQYGNAQPDWIGGLTNTFKYKGLSLSVLMEWRQGGDVIDLGERNALRSGSIKLTERRYEQVVFNGVVKQSDGSFAPNTKAVYLDDLLYNPSTSTRFNGWSQLNIQDASWFRIRTVNINYALSKKVLGNSVFKNGVRFSLTGTNLFLNTPFRGYDPEALTFGSGTNLIGFVGRNNPSTRSFQFGVTANF